MIIFFVLFVKAGQKKKKNIYIYIFDTSLKNWISEVLLTQKAEAMGCDERDAGLGSVRRPGALILLRKHVKIPAKHFISFFF